jgi:hypothetical protein
MDNAVWFILMYPYSIRLVIDKIGSLADGWIGAQSKREMSS